MKLYLNFDFLKNLIMSENETDTHFYVKKLLSSPQKGTELFIDFDPEEVYKDDNKRAVMRKIAQKIPIWSDTFLKDCQSKEFHETGEAKIFFMDNVSLSIEKQYGCILITTSNIEKADLLFYIEPFRINRSQHDWSILKHIKHPCNSLVLTDNYMLVNDTNYENTISILSTLMPSELSGDIEFQITIIGYSPKESREVKRQAEDLTALLKAKFSYPIRLTIIRADHHGRYIHTNYFRFFCEKGFGLFRNKRIRENDETSVDCQPITLSGRYATVLQTRSDEIQKCVAINRTERMADKFAGSRKNRLLQ